MAMQAKKRSAVRIGPISILVFVITVCIAVMATLAVTTTHANTASTDRQMAFTTDVYANESAAQEFLADVDTALAGGTSRVKAQLGTIVSKAQATLADGEVTAELDGSTLSATFESSSGRQLLIELELSGTTYTVTKWKIATNWEEDTSDTLWQG